VPTLSLQQLSDLVGGEVRGDERTQIRGAASIARVQPGEITLADAPKLLSVLAASPAAAAVVTPDFPSTTMPCLLVQDVHTAFTKIVLHFRPLQEVHRVGRSPAAYVARSARLADDVQVHPLASVGEDVVVGSGTVIHAGVHIMAGCRIGRDVTLFPNVVIYENTVIGDRTVIHACAAIGAYGFGYHTVNGVHVRGAQLGNVEIGSDVEIGAGTTIDRGTYDATVIGDGTKIDNQVMIGHNCRLGKHNLICSQVGIAGSCTTGDYVVMAGQVGLSDHLHIGSRAILGAKAGLMNDVPDGAVFIGVPATPERDQWRMWGHVRQLPDMRRQLKKIMQQLDISPPRDSQTDRQDAA
jgi:UDP-3-O-[3-hydroxymyristoyl] glucosamine N-acyltransferase